MTIRLSREASWCGESEAFANSWVLTYLSVVDKHAPVEDARSGAPARSHQVGALHAITARLVAKVHELRAAQGLSAKSPAHETDLATWTLQHMAERGSDPRLTTVHGLCRGLDVTAGERLDDLPLAIEARPRCARGYSSGQELTRDS
jgi:hypothetical protein